MPNRAFKILGLLVSLLFASSAFAQWTNITAGPPTYCYPKALVLDLTDNTIYTGSAQSSCILQASAGGSPLFSAILSGTNLSAAMLIGTGSSLGPSGAGTVTANAASGTAIAQTGVDINTSFQVTGLHLTVPLIAGQLPATTVYNNQSNTFSTGTQDFSGVTLLRARVAAGLTTTVNGDFGYDTTNKNWHMFGNAVDTINPVVPVSVVPVTNNCVKWTVTAGVITLNDAGSACGSGGFANPMTTIADLIVGGAAGAAARLAGPTAVNGIPYSLNSTSTAGVAGTEVWGIPGVAFDAQVGTSYTVPITDDVKLLTLNNAAAIAVTGFALANNYTFAVKNLGAGLATYTPASGTVNGNATQLIPQFWFGFHYTDNTNTQMPIMPTFQAFPTCTAVTCGIGFNPATGAFSANTIVPTSVNITGGTAGFIPKFSAGNLVPSLADDGITTANALTYTGTAGMRSPSFTSTGTTAGYVVFPQGTTSTASNPATSILEQAPAAVTSYTITKPAAAPTIASFKQTDTCGSSNCTESYHPASIVLRVTADFTDASATTLQNITGLGFTFPINSALNAKIDCDILYNQTVAAVADAWGVQDVTVAPTNVEATGFTQTAATTWAEQQLLTLATTTATNIGTFTPSAITTVFHAQLHALVEHPSNASTSAFNIMVSQSTAADLMVIKRGSTCLVTFQ